MIAQFTSKERDAETGLDYFGARYFSSSQGRFTSPDPTFLNILKVIDPQRWNLYSYTTNNPLGFIDPDGNETIAINYPGYQVGIRNNTSSGNITAPAGHAGVVTVAPDGSTDYFEYGRYAGPDGIVRNAGPDNTPTPSVQRDAAGNITPDSMKQLMGTLSDAAGKHGPVDALVIKTTPAQDAMIKAYLEARQRQNNDPNRQKYSLWSGHNCGTLVCDALGAAGRPSNVNRTLSTPGNIFYGLGLTNPGSQQFEYTPPKEKVTSKICYNDSSGKQVCQ